MKMKLSGLEAYQQQKQSKAEVANPEQLISMLLEKLVDTLLKSRHCIKQDEPKKKHNYISLSLDIILALDQSLNFERGGDISKTLHDLYLYCMKRLTAANSLNDQDAVTEVIQLIKVIQDSWVEVMEKKNAPLSA